MGGTYQGIHQPLMSGSYIVVPHDDVLNVQSFSLCAYIFPTTPHVDTEGVEVGVQGLITKWDESTQTGFGLFINVDGELALRIGAGRGKVEEFATGKPLMRKVWYKVTASFDAQTRAVRLSQKAYVTNTNGGHGMSMLFPYDDTNGEFEGGATIQPAVNDCPLLLAASCAQAQSDDRSTVGILKTYPRR